MDRFFHDATQVVKVVLVFIALSRVMKKTAFCIMQKTPLMEIKGFSQCIAANKQQACGLAAAASCGMVAACEFFVCKLVLLLLVAATLRLVVAATMQLLVAATMQLFVAATMRLIVCCNLAACAFFVCKLDFSLLVAACLLQTAAAFLLKTAASCN